MQQSQFKPHISWSGPQPAGEADAYLLAMLLRVHSAGQDDNARDPLQAPSVLTMGNLHAVAIVYAFYKEMLDGAGIDNTTDMLKLIKAAKIVSVSGWLESGKKAVKRAELELQAYTERPGQNGFTVFG